MAYNHGRRSAMNPRASYNFHLPLPSDLHEMLRDEVERSGQPATTLARQALYDWLKQRRKQRLHEEIATYAAAHAGTEADLDPDLEQVSTRSLISPLALR
jgi:hypothetical protein